MSDSWLTGSPMDPLAVPADRLPATPGVPFGHAGAFLLGTGATGGGRSSLMQAAIIDAALTGARCAYLGCEVGPEEFNARAASLAQRRGWPLTEELRGQLALARYLDLPTVIPAAWADPAAWVEGMTNAYDVVIIDPISAVASALDADFDKSNAEYNAAFDRLFQPLTARGLLVGALDNIGHSLEAKHRAKGASAKADRADVTFTCVPSPNPIGLIIRIGKVRSIRAPFARGDEFLFDRDTQRIQAHGGATDAWRPTVLMERAWTACHDTPGLSLRGIREALGGNAANADNAIRYLIADGHLEARTEGRARRHYTQNTYPPEPTVSTCPTVSGTRLDTPVSERVHVSESLRTDTGHIDTTNGKHDPLDALIARHAESS